MRRLPHVALALALLVAVGVAVFAALLTVGGPGTARLEKLDERRARDVVELVNAIERHRVFTGRLPDSLDELRAGMSGQPPLRDPGTGAPYDYEALGERRFRVCARLALPDAAPPVAGPIRMAESTRFANPVPDPGSGRLCWETAEPPG